MKLALFTLPVIALTACGGDSGHNLSASEATRQRTGVIEWAVRADATAVRVSGLTASGAVNRTSTLTASGGLSAYEESFYDDAGALIASKIIATDAAGRISRQEVVDPPSGVDVCPSCMTDDLRSATTVASRSAALLTSPILVGSDRTLNLADQSSAAQLECDRAVLNAQFACLAVLTCRDAVSCAAAVVGCSAATGDAIAKCST